MTKNCKNCMWGNQCSTAEECDYYDPLEDDDSEVNDEVKRQEWQAYLHYVSKEDESGDK